MGAPPSTFEILKSQLNNSGVADPSYFDNLLGSVGLYQNINNYNGMYRYGKFDPDSLVPGAKEYAFFTKPDLHILNKSGNLVSGLSSYPFFINLKKNYPNVIKELQLSANGDKNPFSNLLFNMKKSTSYIDVPGLTANTIDNPTNMFGTAYDYRGSSEASNDNFDFSIEFVDTKNLDTYMYFRAYDEYETLKVHGKVAPKKSYTINKILHDAIGIYKFIVDEDGETILYYAYYTGVTFKSFGRDVFSNPNFDDGISYSIDCKCPFMEDMNPLILEDFNEITRSYRDSNTSETIHLYDASIGRVSAKKAKSAYVTQVYSKKYKRKVYKLKWRA